MDNDVSLNVQNGFFNQARKDKVRIAVFMLNGQKMTGFIKAFDRFTLILDTRHGDQLIFKHAISMISPDRAAEASARPDTKPEAKGFGNFMDLEGKKQ